MNLELEDFSYVNEIDKELVEQFIASKNVKKYILGINKLTKSVLKHVEVDGIIDDFTRVQRSRKKEILQIEEVEKDAIILWTSTGSPLEVKKRLDLEGFKNISYLAFYRYCPFELVDPPFIVDFKEDFRANSSEYFETYKLLADEKSKEIFKKVLNFKMTFDYSFMEGFTNSFEEQYFDFEIIPRLKNISFFDGGGYVGDTAMQVIKHFADFKKIYLVEPIEANIKIAKRELAEFKNIEFLECGLSNKKATLSFNEEKSFSTIYGSGSQSIKVDTIDNILNTQSIDFIKLDIEGAEQDAIEGAKKCIEKDTPILAICIYHKAEDWYKIPQKVLSINSNYKIYIRHYMEGIFETVMYFIPNK
ncbi:MAG: FkbM family methyltransferase [Helicobacteraceae bacterium]|nr:FkbM family methyltransferase [Helicobacteraceae bacterium]